MSSSGFKAGSVSNGVLVTAVVNTVPVKQFLGKLWGWLLSPDLTHYVSVRMKTVGALLLLSFDFF